MTGCKLIQKSWFLFYPYPVIFLHFLFVFLPTNIFSISFYSYWWRSWREEGYICLLRSCVSLTYIVFAFIICNVLWLSLEFTGYHLITLWKKKKSSIILLLNLIIFFISFLPLLQNVHLLDCIHRLTMSKAVLHILLLLLYHIYLLFYSCLCIRCILFHFLHLQIGSI